MLEGNADVAYITEVEWDEGYWDIDYVRKDGGKVEVKLDPVTGKPSTERRARAVPAARCSCRTPSAIFKAECGIEKRPLAPPDERGKPHPRGVARDRPADAAPERRYQEECVMILLTTPADPCQYTSSHRAPIAGCSLPN